MSRQPAVEQIEVFPGDTLEANPRAVGVVHVSSHVRRAQGQRRAVGAPAAPVPLSIAARNRWVLEQLEAWRKAEHAATQARSQGAKCRRIADDEYAGLPARFDEWTAKAEACYQLAEQHSQRALEIRLALTARVR